MDRPGEERLDVRPLVLGSGGLVGGAVAALLEARCPHTVAATRAELDLTDRWRLEAELERLAPTVVVNCAAIADLEACEEDPEEAHRVNAEGPANLARACRNCGIRLIHLSTDYVFDGQKDGEYAEDDPPAPLGVYGRTKLLGEMGVLEELVDAVVLRVSFVHGPGRPTFLDRLARELRAGRTVPAVDGWRTRPTFNTEIARAIELLLDADVTGVLHFANRPAVTRLEFAREVARLTGADPGLVVPVDPASLGLAAPRPRASVLSTGLWERTFGEAPADWRFLARDYLGGVP